jgi:molybdopterin molybdotransferase
VPAGRVISGLTLGVLASVGISRVMVVARPRVTVVSSGSELVAIDAVPAPGQIRDSNRHTLMAMIEGARCRTADGGRVADTPEELALSIREGLKSDVLVFSGGVSAGEYDLVAKALLDEGVELLLHKVAIKPGKPVLVGRHPGGLVFGLPGNPVSTFVTAELLLLPALRMLAGRPDPGPWEISARLVGRVPRTRARTTFHPGAITRAGGGFEVRPVAWNGSGDQIGFASGNCLIRREREAPEASDGESVTVLLPRVPVD